jgi:hypothetical protein
MKKLLFCVCLLIIVKGGISMADLILQGDSLVVGSQKMNAAMLAFEEAMKTGDSSFEAAHARVNASGARFNTLRDRLNDSDKTINSKVDKGYVDSVAESIASGSPKPFATLAALQADSTANTVDGKKRTYVVTADGKWYWWNSTAWTVGGTYQSTGISNNSVTLNKLDAGLRAEITNLVDDYRGYSVVAGNSNLLPGAKTVSNTIANASDNKFLCTELIDISNYDFLAVNHENSAGYKLLVYGNIMDASLTKLTGAWVNRLNGDIILNRAATLNAYPTAKYVAFTFAFSATTEASGITTLPSTYQIEVRHYQAKGDSYENVLVVAKSGGDFTSIQAAATAANSSLRVTILVMPGIYEEAASAVGKNISIVGVNKHECILIDHSGNYDTPPLEISAPFYVANMTIIATHEESIETNKSLWKSYAAHVDYPSYSGVGEFNNCILESDHMAAIGAGLGQDTTLKLVNCELISNTDSDSEWLNYGALYAHNKLSAATNQHLIIDNCKIISKNGQAMNIKDTLVGGSVMDVSAYNNMVYSKILGKTGVLQVTTPVGPGKLSGNSISLNADSYGNNISVLNAE